MKNEIKQFHKLGTIGRFRPLHKGAALMLETICESADEVLIGIGSCNKEKYGLRNPFTPEEVKEMINLYLSPKFSNYRIYYFNDYGHIPQYSDGQRWKQDVISQFDGLDAFVTGNEYSAKLLEPHYKIIHPADLIPRERWVWVKGTMVRVEMAKGGDGWKDLVPKEIVPYLDNGIVQRFRKEFGLQTLASLAGTDYISHEDYAREKNHITEV